MNGIVFLCQRAFNTHKLHTDDAQSALLKTADDFTSQPALYAVWLDND